MEKSLYRYRERIASAVEALLAAEPESHSTILSLIAEVVTERSDAYLRALEAKKTNRVPIDAVSSDEEY